MKLCGLALCLITAACATPIGSADPPSTSSETSEVVTACTQQCNNSWSQCNSVCERFPRPNCEESCDTRLSNCLHACGCPISQEFDRVSFDHADPTNTFVCVGPFSGPGVFYQQYNTFQRTDHIRDTLECDGSTTETVLSSTVTSSGACFHRLFPDVSCQPTQTTGTGLCTL